MEILCVVIEGVQARQIGTPVPAEGDEKLIFPHEYITPKGRPLPRPEIIGQVNRATPPACWCSGLSWCKEWSQRRLVAGKFCSDLFYRLARFTIEVPPSRERREDVALARHFADALASEMGMARTDEGVPSEDARILSYVREHGVINNRSAGTCWRLVCNVHAIFCEHCI